MNNEETKPSKDMMDTISEQFDRMYEKGLEHGVNLSISVVQKVMQMPHDAIDVYSFYQKVISELNNLKNKQQ